MSVKVGINGFGRIGKLTFQAALEKKEVEIYYSRIYGIYVKI